VRAPTGVSHAPQWSALSSSETHEAPHWVWPRAQLDVHAEPSQTCPGVQAGTPQAPQLAGSKTESSQPFAAIMSQSRNPATHSQVAPPTHASLAPQATPQAPQSVTVTRAISQPSIGSPLQSSKPGAHAHALAAQFSLVAQAMPHAPQLAASMVMSASQPLTTLPSQSRRFAGQAHSPATHVWSGGQTTAQLPQCAASVCRLVSQPFVTMFWSQSSKPSRQIPVQLLLVQAVFGHALPQAPQLRGS
jgi:hypothetical protein